MNINSNDGTMNLLKLGLNASSLRGQTIANNMSNINTENYKRSYVDFEGNLSNEVEKITLKKTREEHLDGTNSSELISIKQDNSTSMRTDGNNVDLDIEKVNQATNSLMYNALITQANSKLNMTKSVINGGN